MIKYLKFIVIGIAAGAGVPYWAILSVIVAAVIWSAAVNTYARYTSYFDAEQEYSVTVGYIIKNGMPVPERIYYTENGKRIPVPRKNVSITDCGNNIYDIYTRIRRHDGDGYDYIISTLKRTGMTEFETMRTTCGREVSI